MLTVNVEIDLRGLCCPLPVLRVKKALSDMCSGEILRALTSDPGAAEDIPAFLNQSGHALQDIAATADGHCFIIIKH